MTLSILARDPETGAFGGAAVTGNLCVGGWVLRGDARAGMTASQGLTPSTLWGEAALEALREGCSAAEAVEAVVAADPGRAVRQVAALDAQGGTGAFDGDGNEPFIGNLAGPGWIVCGNWLGGPRVIEAASEGFMAKSPEFEDRLIEALARAEANGGDARGARSAALLVLAPNRPPLNLRIDDDLTPVTALRRLLDAARAPAYRDWLATLPTLADPWRAP